MADGAVASDLSALDISKLKVPDLKRELKMRGLSTAGNKNDLVERLQAHVKGSDATSVDEFDEDLLNDDDDEHLDSTVINELELDDSPTTKAQKRKSLDQNDVKNGPTKKVILNRNNTQVETAKVTKPVVEPVEETVEEGEEKNGSVDDKKVVKLSQLSAKERLEMRAKKFGVAIFSVDAKKAARAERFASNSSSGATSIKTVTVNTSLDVLKQRAERFGGSVSTVMSGLENKEKLEKRKARFGVISTPTVNSDKKQVFVK